MATTAGGGVKLRDIAREAPEALRHGWVVRAPATHTSHDGEWMVVSWWCGPDVADGRTSSPLWEADEDIMVWGDPLWFPTSGAALAAIETTFGMHPSATGYVPLRIGSVAGFE